MNGSPSGLVKAATSQTGAYKPYVPPVGTPGTGR